MDLERIREEIDDIDRTLLSALKRRFELSDRAVDLKRRDMLPIEDKDRETEILSAVRAGAGDSARYLLPVFESVLAQSRRYQENAQNPKHGRYALIGKGLQHSYSPDVHAKFGLREYGILDIEEGELERTLHCPLYRGFNITAPYKSEVIKYCDYVSDEVMEIGCANTVVRGGDGRLSCYNTDLNGLLFLAKLNGIDFENRKVVILGSGGASKTVRAAARILGAGEIAVVSRKGEYNYDNISIHDNAQIVVNATSVGMYPHNLERVVGLDKFPSCEGVIDVIYNPHRTMLIMEAEQRGVKCADGLAMLVYQAKATQELFFNTQFFEDKTLQTLMVFHKLRHERENIVLIGMPGCGKTAVGKILAKRSGKLFVDTDEELQRALGRTAAEIIVEYGEGFFRRVESMIIAAAGKQTGCVIATGGGAVSMPENYFSLHQNGRIYCLKRDLRLLETDGRPLSVNLSVLEKMLAVRQADYTRFADLMIDNNAAPEAAADAIMEDFNEISYY